MQVSRKSVFVQIVGAFQGGRLANRARPPVDLCAVSLFSIGIAAVYSLCALPGRSQELGSQLAAHPRLPLVSLAEGLALLPLSERWLQQVQRDAVVEGDGGLAPMAHPVFEFLTPTVEHWIGGLSKSTPVAYVETEYFAGEGFERAADWRDGATVLGPMDGAGAINRALRFLGVVAEPGREEFDIVGLGRHRTLEEWLAEAARTDPRDDGRDGGLPIKRNP